MGLADENSVFAYVSGFLLGFLAVTGIGQYVMSSTTQSLKKTGRVQSYNTEEPLL
jgi:hypothetical protein